MKIYKKLALVDSSVDFLLCINMRAFTDIYTSESSTEKFKLKMGGG